MHILAMTLTGLGLALSATSYLVLWNTGAWIVRGWDFPRGQLLFLEVLTLVGVWWLPLGPLWTGLAAALVCGAIALDAFRIFRYLPTGWGKTIANTQGEKGAASLSILSSNVLQQNRDFSKLISLIEEKQPDVFIGLETDDDWAGHLSQALTDYPHRVEVPQDNEYGMCLYSRLPLEHPQVLRLVDEKVPSICTRVSVSEETSIVLFVLHPRPPRPQEGASHERDASLMEVAKEISGQEGHFIVVGDLNDVAWSHTTRLFLRVSGLCDPRIGRGLFTTFPSHLPFLRFPLDHAFLSDNFTLNGFGCLPAIGSDHLPIYLSAEVKDQKRQRTGEMQSDREEVQELTDRKRLWDGPNREEEV